MKRRDFLRTASVATGGTATAVGASSTAAAQEGTETSSGTTTPAGTATAGEGGGGGETHTVDMTDQLVFEPEDITIEPGDTVVWENVGAVGHSVTAYEEEIPDGATYWASGGFDSEQAARDSYPSEGNIPGGESYEHTFETTGEHAYFCIPHETVEMVGTVTVQEAGAGGGGGGEAVAEEVDPEEMGVPIQAHWVGSATILAIVISLIFTFFQLKYGETPHSGYPE
ncbi:MAG: plastocyanin/azurin family copper-binding protein, partial [Halobacteriales archaeon]|nr:plastocyanin/azurin family copper-binding protein [Halobacteriales archaeon]